MVKGSQMPAGPQSLGEVFVRAAERQPERPALVIDKRSYTYGELLDLALRLAAAIRRTGGGEVPLCAVSARRSVWAYAGVLGILLSGRGYVPLCPAFPAPRTRQMLELSGATTIVADTGSLEALGQVVCSLRQPLVVLLPECSLPPPWAAQCPQHRMVCAGELPAPGAGFTLPGSGDTAYLLFTSGSTGIPKGVGIQQQNAMAYLDGIRELLDDLGPEDRFSQNFEMIFDLSVHDLFVCWGCGACLYVHPQGAGVAPAAFVRKHELTCWFSTPSTAVVLQRLRMIRPGGFPSLRWSLFCGEPLPLHLAETWQLAAPRSTVVNLYGPTEATIACIAYVYREDSSSGECANGIVPIGRPFGSTRVIVAGDGDQPVAGCGAGELLLGGGQVAPGYWRDAARTALAFVSLPGATPCGPWYRTGDLVERNTRGNLVYRGRKDHQLKIMGHRVELQEIEEVARETASARQAIALGWPQTASGAEAVILFLAGAQAPDEAILAGCRRRLPPYMIPREIHRLEELPLSANQKVDRKALLRMRAGLT